MTIKKIFFCYGSKGDILNLSALNQKLAKLVGAKRVTIYSTEDEYMATKRGNQSSDSKLIDIQRSGQHLGNVSFIIIEYLKIVFAN